MNLGISGKKALVTGAGRGIGSGIVESLVLEGVKVAFLSRTKKDLEKLHRGSGGKKAGHYFVVSDLTNEGEPEKVFEEIKKNFGVPEILVNNLGGTLEVRDPYCSIGSWRKLWRLNLEVAIELNNLVIPYMKKKKWGRIVNIASIAGLENQGPVPYCTMKAALIAYSRSMGRILSKEGIMMCSLLPGAIMTKGGYWEKISKSNPQHVKKYLSERMASGRFGSLLEIAAFVTFLCSAQASFTVGGAYPVDGGQGRTFFGV